MKLHECTDWRAVHFGDRTILKVDLLYMTPSPQYSILHDLDVYPLESPGHYRVEAINREEV